MLKKLYSLLPSSNISLSMSLFILVNFLSASVLYFITVAEKENIRVELQSRANQIHRHLQMRFNYHIETSQVLKRNLEKQTEMSEEYFNEWVLRFLDYMPMFQAIGFVSPEGIIELSLPAEKNKAALKKNLFERETIAKILMQDVAKFEMRHSPPLELFQGTRGIVFYIPIYMQGQFKGWLNLVMDLNSFVGELFQDPQYKKQGLVIIDKFSGEELVRQTKDDSKFETQYFDFPFFERRWTIGITKETDSLYPIFTVIVFSIVLVLSFLLCLFLKLYLDSVDAIKESLRDALSEGNLLRALCHDMGTPLTMAELLTERIAENLDENGLGLVKQLHEAHGRQFSMLSSVRELQRLKSQKHNFKLVPVDVWKLLDSLERTFVESLAAKQQRLIVSPNSSNRTELFVCGHIVCFEHHILGNLISNAIKFGPRGSDIIIAVSREKEWVKFIVKDSGIGMSKASIEFFNQGRMMKSSIGTEGELGTGFGLALVKNFTELLAGKIEIQPQETGTQIALWFKIAHSQS